jgi:hypothetical protein
MKNYVMKKSVLRASVPKKDNMPMKMHYINVTVPVGTSHGMIFGTRPVLCNTC